MASCSNSPIGQGGGDAVAKVDDNGQLAFDLDKDSYAVKKIEESRQECYKSIVDVEAQKAKANAPLIAFLTAQGRSEMSQIVALQMITMQNMMRIAFEKQQEAPIKCNQMGIYEYKIARNGQIFGFGKDILNIGYKVFKIDTGAKLAKHVVDKLSEPKVQSGDNSTNVLGDNNNIDQRQFDGGDCVGTVDADTGRCLVAPEEEEMPEEEQPQEEQPEEELEEEPEPEDEPDDLSDEPEPPLPGAKLLKILGS